MKPAQVKPPISPDRLKKQDFGGVLAQLVPKEHIAALARRRRSTQAALV